MSFQPELAPAPAPAPDALTQLLGSAESVREVGLVAREVLDVAQGIFSSSSVGVAGGLAGLGWGVVGGLLVGMVIGGVVVWYFLTQTDNDNGNGNNNNSNRNSIGNVRLPSFRLPF